MGSDGKGTIYIPLEEFWAFVAKYAPNGVIGAGEIRYGVPRVNKGAGDLEVSYAFSTDCAPESWGEKPPAVTEWEKLP